MMVAADGSGRWLRTVVKINGERIHWYEVRKYKIEGEKIGTK